MAEPAEGVDVAKWVQKQILNIKKIRCCNYSAERTFQGKKPGRATESETSKFNYVEMGDRFLFELTDNDPEKKVGKVAYNGKYYQWLNKWQKNKTMFITQNRMVTSADIKLGFFFFLWEPYRFLLPNAPEKARGKNPAFTLIPTAASIADDWRSFEKAQYIGKESKLDHPCKVFECPLPENILIPKGGFSRIWFAEDLGDYPIAYQLFDANKVLICSYYCSAIGEVKDPNGQVFYYPKSSEMMIILHGDSVVLSGTISKITINQEMSDDLFTINPLEADEIVDGETGTTITLPAK